MKGTCKSFLDPLDSSENTGEEAFIVRSRIFTLNEPTGKKWSQ